MPQVVFFDLGRTLVDGAAISPAQFIAAMINQPAEADNIAHILLTNRFLHPVNVCRTLRHYYQLSSRQEELIYSLWQEQLSAARLVPGALSLVRAVKAAGCRIGLISDIWEPFWQSICTNCRELIELVDSATLSFLEKIRKPSLELYRRALNSLSCTAPEAVMIGDTYSHDILPAYQLGMQTIWVLRRPEKEARALIAIINRQLPLPHAACAHLEEILPILKKWLDLKNAGELA